MTTFSELYLLPVALRAKSVQERTEELINFIKIAPKNSLILASELCITGYEADFTSDIITVLKNALTHNKILGFTRFNKIDSKIYNEFELLTSDEILYIQPKCKLFKPNLEHEKFDGGSDEGIKIFEFKGVKFGALICFELRFSELWAKLKGAEIILAPAMWGKERADAYLSLCKALAIANNCYVVASSSLDLEFAGVFSPTGEFQKEAKFDRNLIKQTKLNLGIL